MKPKKLTFTPLLLPELIEVATHFDHSGDIATTEQQLTYLNIDDDYIHRLFPLLQQHYPDTEKPDYFGDGLIGAHISVMYPEEETLLQKKEIGSEHEFKITGAYSAILAGKKYYVLAIQAPTLIALRKRHHLSEALCFKGHWVHLHATIGVSRLI